MRQSDRQRRDARSGHEIVEHLFRHEYGRILASLLHEFGFENLRAAEDSIQEAFLRALRIWPLRGLPDNPAAWLHRVARNCTVDQLRRQGRTQGSSSDSPAKGGYSAIADASVSRNLEGTDSDLLAMMFACCSRSIPPDAQVAIILKWLSGFSTREISKALLQSEDTVAQRISRARRKLQQDSMKLILPSRRELMQRLPVVQQALYLLFNEGYTSSHGDALLRRELCFEAIRLTEKLLDSATTAQPSTFALMALFCFHAARFDTRIGGASGLLLLADQDRTRWDRRLVARGAEALKQASTGTELSRYHLEAGIASCHMAARSFAETNWKQIIYLYEQLLRLTDSPVVALNYATAVSYHRGTEAASSILSDLAGNPRIEGYYLYWAVQADFARRSGDSENATLFYRKAIELTENEAERSFLKGRLKSY